MHGCSNVIKNEPCHSYVDCPGYIYALAPEFIEPDNQGSTEVDAEPQLLAASIPIYPGDAWRHKVEGFAVFEFDVSPAGKPTNIRVVEYHPGVTFVNAGKNAIRLSLYTKTKNGATGLRRRLTWTMDGKGPKPPVMTTAQK
jgi:outer membrane biosynthesis protein TonB